MRTLQDKVVVITGAAGGIGAALAHAFAQAGARLALVDRDGPGLERLAATLPATSHPTQHVVDLLQPGATDALAEAVRREHGAAHVLVNNAGLTVHGAFADHDAGDLDRLLDLNLRVPQQACRAFLPMLRASGDAHVVNLSSLAAMVGIPTQATYSASKAGLRTFTEALRIEWAPLGIGVTAVLPGTIATPFLRHATSHDLGASNQMAELMLRYGTSPERVATRTLRAVMRNRAEVRVGWDAHLTALVQTVAPGMLHHLLRVAWWIQARRSA